MTDRDIPGSGERFDLGHHAQQTYPARRAFGTMTNICSHVGHSVSGMTLINVLPDFEDWLAVKRCPDTNHEFCPGPVRCTRNSRFLARKPRFGMTRLREEASGLRNHKAKSLC